MRNFARLGTLWSPYDHKPDQLKYNKRHITLLKTWYFKTINYTISEFKKKWNPKIKLGA